MARRRWLPTFLAFPPSGLAAVLVIGQVDAAPAAVVGGAIAGAGIGAAQAWALRPWSRSGAAWIAITSAAMAIGLAAGAALVGYRTGAADLTLMGLVTGAALGLAQGLELVRQRVAGGRRATVWAAAMPVLWVAGWNVTRLAGVDVEAQYAVFGATGALAFSVLSGLLLAALLPAPPADDRR